MNTYQSTGQVIYGNSTLGVVVKAEDGKTVFFKPDKILDTLQKLDTVSFTVKVDQDDGYHYGLSVRKA